MNDSLNNLAEKITANVNRQEDIRLKCIEIAAQMMGPQPIEKGETVQQFLNRFLPLSNVVELHVTGRLPKQAGS